MKQQYPEEFKPPPALSEIMPGLWMGRRPESYAPYSLAISCEEHLAKKPMEGYMGLTFHVPMRDEDDFLPPDHLVAAAARAAQQILRFGSVMVHCTGGLNRSGLMVGAILKECNFSAQEAIDLMREQHDPFVLCNRAFERWLTGERLPTAETTTLR